MSLKTTDESVLVVGVNWLGDSIMTMPALQAYRGANPGARIAMLVRPECRDLWSLHAGVDELLVCPKTLSGIMRSVKIARKRQFGTAFVLPRSIRSSIVPFLAGIPRRIGFPGHCRDWMLTQVSKPNLAPGQSHQCHEYMSLFGFSGVRPEPPSLTIPDELAGKVLPMLGDTETIKIGILPGAAYGPSKRWPADYFAETGRLLRSLFKCTILLLGSESERELCAQVAESMGTPVIDLAGRTSLRELAAVLSLCAAVVSNDSGGMHLAAAVGIPVTAIFGITDPDRTGPMGRRVRVLQESAVRDRDLRRRSRLAESSLRRISPQQVLEAVSGLIDSSRI